MGDRRQDDFLERVTSGQDLVDYRRMFGAGAEHLLPTPLGYFLLLVAMIGAMLLAGLLRGTGAILAGAFLVLVFVFGALWLRSRLRRRSRPGPAHGLFEAELSAQERHSAQKQAGRLRSRHH
jgi:hypothetical protein